MNITKHVLVSSHLNTTKMLNGVQGCHSMKPMNVVAAVNMLMLRTKGTCTSLGYTLDGLQKINFTDKMSLQQMGHSILQVRKDVWWIKTNLILLN